MNWLGFTRKNKKNTETPKIESNIPEKVIVTAKGCAPGAAVLLCFKMVRKNDYYIVVFLDSEGRAELTQNQMLERFEAIARYAMMDYIGARGGFTGTIEAEVLAKQAIEDAIQAFERDSFDYPPGYLENLKSALALDTVRDSTVSVERVHL
jgi:hypothetical protein